MASGKADQAAGRMRYKSQALSKSPDGIVPLEPTYEMAMAYWASMGCRLPKQKEMADLLKRTIGTSNEPGFVFGLRAALAVGSGAMKLEEIKRGHPATKIPASWPDTNPKS